MLACRPYGTGTVGGAGTRVPGTELSYGIDIRRNYSTIRSRSWCRGVLGPPPTTYLRQMGFIMGYIRLSHVGISAPFGLCFQRGALSGRNFRNPGYPQLPDRGPGCGRGPQAALPGGYQRRHGGGLRHQRQSAAPGARDQQDRCRENSAGGGVVPVRQISLCGPSRPSRKA
jgi:hypothetical protein